MFSQSIDLLPRGLFSQLLQDALDGGSTYNLLGELFRQMDNKTPALVGRYKGVQHFNGGLFEKSVSFELERKEVGPLALAAQENWGKVEPEIFGTLFQSSMGKEASTRLRRALHESCLDSECRLADDHPSLDRAHRRCGHTE